MSCYKVKKNPAATNIYIILEFNPHLISTQLITFADMRQINKVQIHEKTQPHFKAADISPLSVK